MQAPMVDQAKFDAYLREGKFAEATALFNPATPLSQIITPASQQPQPHSQSLEARIVALEQLVQHVAAPAINEAAHAGAAIVTALGNGMTQEQASWVQQRMNTSPGFFSSQNCKDAIDIFISEWQSYEGGKSK